MRVTKNDLNLLIKSLNSYGVPVELNWAYGGVRIVRRLHSGGILDVGGRSTNRIIYDRLQAMLDAIALYKDAQEHWRMVPASWPAAVCPTLFVGTKPEADAIASRMTDADGITYLATNVGRIHCDNLEGLERVTIIS